jgi:hypothetical protein
MKRVTIIFFAIIVVSVFGCKRNSKSLGIAVDRFAALECRAISLRERRFDLANQIRFTEDSLLEKSNKGDTVRLRIKLNDLNKEKEVVLKQSLSLADTIRMQLDDLKKNQLADEKDKADFDRLLNASLEKRGCLKKT